MLRIGANGVYSDGYSAGPSRQAPAPTGHGSHARRLIDPLDLGAAGWTAQPVLRRRLHRGHDLTRVRQTGLPPSTTCAVSSPTHTITGDGPRPLRRTTLTRPKAGVIGTAAGTTSIQWRWVDPGNASFKVYNSTSGELLASQTQATYTDAGLGVNSPRAISVRTVTPDGDGILYPAATVYTLAAVPGPMIPPLSGLATGGFTLN